MLESVCDISDCDAANDESDLENESGVISIFEFWDSAFKYDDLPDDVFMVDKDSSAIQRCNLNMCKQKHTNVWLGNIDFLLLNVQIFEFNQNILIIFSWHTMLLNLGLEFL